MSECKTCKWLKVGLTETGKRIVRTGNAYQCIAPGPELPAFPASVLRDYGFRWPPSRRYMSASDGADCVSYEKFVKFPPTAPEGAPT